MSAPVKHADGTAGLAEAVAAATGESVFNCYQCGKCTAGCPLAEEMDFAPNQVLRLLQLGQPGMDEEVLGSLSIWLCLTCEQCSTRCPQEVDIPKITDWLRQESQRRGLANKKAKAILAFHTSFLDTIRRGGRLHEVGLITTFKLRTWRLFQDVLVAPKLLARGKLGILPHRIEGHAGVKRIFERCEAAPASPDHKGNQP